MALISAENYHDVYLVTVCILCFLQSSALSSYSNTEHLLYDTYDTKSKALWWCAFLILFIGFRPISKYFADMLNYAVSYENGYFQYDSDSTRREPIWLIIQSICYRLKMPTTMWFATITSIVLIMHYQACRKWFGNQVYPAILFLTTGFYYWSTLTVIIRSGLASAIVMLAMSIFMNDSKKSKFFALALMGIAMYTHTSSVLISVCFLASYYFVKDIKWCIYFWIACLGASLVAGSYFETLLVSLGFDDRMSLITADTDYVGFSHAGFRWDFLLYSVIPIILGWYIHKRVDTNETYSVLLNTYILCNAFWVLVIRALFSDRFAGLSWVLYPVVIAYPFLKMEIWEDQPNKARWALLVHVGFIVFMSLIYYKFMK